MHSVPDSENPNVFRGMVGPVMGQPLEKSGRTVCTESSPNLEITRIWVSNGLQSGNRGVFQQLLMTQGATTEG
jgi:hypothetical protein